MDLKSSDPKKVPTHLSSPSACVNDVQHIRRLNFVVGPLNMYDPGM